MTEPVAPPMDEPLTTLQELAVWTQQPAISEDDEPFALKVLGAVAVEVRAAGSIYWTHATIPPRAKKIADLVAKNFYEHPSGETNETPGPLNSGYIDGVLVQAELTPEQKAVLAEEAGDALDAEPEVTGLWALSIDPGPLLDERPRQGFIPVPYWRATSKPIPYYAPGAFGSPDA
jgi:hypothetical protein